jgi:hypothetical protein
MSELIFFMQKIEAPNREEIHSACTSWLFIVCKLEICNREEICSVFSTCDFLFLSFW